MDALELLDIVGSGETSKVQFKEKFPHQDSVAAEMVAMSNSLGGRILFGIADKTGEIKGLTGEEIRDYSSRLGNISSNLVSPPVNITTEVVSVENGDSKKVLIANIEEGTNKPYKDNNGTIWVKKTSDKRKLTDNNEILRLFQASNNLMADEMPVNQASIEDINEEKFRFYFEKLRNRTIEQEGLSYEKALHVKRVMLKGKVSLGGLLFFGLNPQYFKTYTGGCIDKLIENNIQNEEVRYISGNVLTGTRIKPKGFLGYYDNLLTVIKEGSDYDFMGWIKPTKKRLSFHRALGLFSFIYPNQEYKLDTNQRGEERPFVQTGIFERVTPMDILPTFLLKAILAEDYDDMEALGIFEVIEEDLALCEFVDVSKHNVQEIVRDGINLIQYS